MGASTTDRDQAKTRSRSYFDNHNRSPFAFGGYWRLDYCHSLQKIESIEPDTLIDIGCGPGAFLASVHKRFPSVRLFALDLSTNMAKTTQERLGDAVVATVGDAEEMPFEDSRFDVVTCNMSIHHYPHPLAALCEMRRILKPGGTLLLNDMDCIPPVRAAANALFPRLPGGDVKMYNRTEILSMLDEVGLRVVMYKKISPFSFLCVARKGADA